MNLFSPYRRESRVAQTAAELAGALALAFITVAILFACFGGGA